MRLKTRFLLVISLLAMSLFSVAQSHENETDDTLKVKINSLEDFAKQAKLTFRSRSFFMSTINNGSLKDDYTFAQGAGLGMLTAPVKGFQLGFSGYFIFNVFSSDLATPDKTTGAYSRYEVGQYDVTNLKNNHYLSRFEDLYLKYSYKQNTLKLGRMEMNTPFINGQDGRMRPTYVEGATITLKKNDKISFDASYVWRISPRSTYQYYLLKDATGLYGQGFNPSGTKSDYKNNIKTIVFFTGHVLIQPRKNVQINLWDGYFENVMNTAIIELKHDIKIKENSNFYHALMYIRQDAVNQGGNENRNKTYIQKGAQSNTISAQLGYKNKGLHVNANYTLITGDGRYLMPREWGRDPFYTFMPRERNEGSGNVNAFTTNINYFTAKQKLKMGLGYGYFLLPAISKVALNKYGMPAYHQVNLSGTYQFQNFWKGMELRMLVAGKIKADNDYIAPKFVYNRVNMINFNLILDIKI